MSIEEAKAWIKKYGYLVKNIDIKIDEPIKNKSHYIKLYKPSGGSISGDGFCLFYDKGTSLSLVKETKGTLHPFDEELEKEVFNPDIPLDI